jgi:hypothetical protein
MSKALEGGEGSASRPGHSLLREKTRYPLYRRLGESQGQSGQVRKILPPPGFDPRTIQPVASRYTDYATRPTDNSYYHHHLSVMELGHLLTRAGLMDPEASSKVFHCSFCQLGNSVSLPWVIYYGAFYLHVVSSFSCIPALN